MPQWPQGLLVLGDAYCIYDPIFGQGMTVAAISVEILEACLREQRAEKRPDWEHGVLRRIKEAIEPAFWLNCTADLRWEGVEYEGADSSKRNAFSREYMELFLRYAVSKPDWKFYGLYWAVNTLAVSPRNIFNPETAVQVLTASDEGRKLLSGLTADNGQPVETILEEILPRFPESPFELVRP